MKRRLRKKRRMGEFTEHCFNIRFAMSTGLVDDGRNLLLDEFIDEIERLGLQVCGGGTCDWDGFAELEGRDTATERHRTAILAWLESHPNIEDSHVGELVDAWHGWD